MMDTTTTTATAPGEMDFSTFVLDLTQSPKIDCSGGATGSRCCAPESRLSAEFENKMQKLINNFDLDDLEEGGLGMPTRFCDPEPVLNDDLDSSVLADRDYPVESLDTTVDNEDDPLNLTEEDLDDSGDAGCSSDEQQQESRSLSLSYSLSISHAQENFSQYSQSTGLSKRYDSPCSYEDDRESECTNFDKLDDWSDLINDLHNNNNNNVDAANREFKEYLDDIRGKEQNGTSSTSGIETSEEGTNDTKEPSEACEEEMATEKQSTLVEGSKNVRDSRPDTPALERKATARENCHSYLDYRDPGLDDFDDDAVMRGSTTIDSNSNLVLMSTPNGGRNSSVKRKLCEDQEDCARQLELIVEKFQKTDIVPDHGQHASLVEDETFSRWRALSSPNKTPTVGSEKPGASCMDDENQTDDEKLIMLDGEEEDEDPAVATTPTNPRNIHRLFRPAANGEDDENLELVSVSDSQLFTKQRYLKKVVGRVDLAQTVSGSSRKSLKLPLMDQQQQQ